MNKSGFRTGSLIVLVCFLVSLTGCALSPQVIDIKPDIDTNAKVESSPTVSLRVIDGRSSPVIGQRGGIYKDTSNISTGENMTKTLRNSLVLAMQQQGYSISDQADTHLNVEVAEINYMANSEKLLNKIEIGVVVKARAAKAGRDFTGEYRANRKKDYVKLPSIEENEKIVNETLASVLGSMLADDDLISFLKP